MVDWTASMQQTFEYYEVNPETWTNIRRLDNVKSSSITRDSTVETLGSATLDVTESVGECYIRIYLVTIQNGVTEKHPLGTYLVQTPSSSFDGKIRNVTMDAYTPLLELKEKYPPIGYYTPKNENIMDWVYRILTDKVKIGETNSCKIVRAPVVKTNSNEIIQYDFVADTNDTWLTYVSDLITFANHSFELDDMGRILFAPKQETTSLQPIWTYDDNNSSILYPEFSIDHDMYNIPNVVEVIYSKNRVTPHKVRAINKDPDSPLSIVNRGREIVKRVTDPSLTGNPSNPEIDEYAVQLLKEVSTLEYTVSYTHAYCPVRVGDCVRLNYVRSGITDVKARVISQSIKCEPGCPVTEKAVFTNNSVNAKYIEIAR